MANISLKAAVTQIFTKWSLQVEKGSNKTYVEKLITLNVVSEFYHARLWNCRLRKFFTVHVEHSMLINGVNVYYYPPP